MKLNRIIAVILRNLFEMRHNWVRLIDVFFWPLLDILLWGFFTLYILKNNYAVAPIASMLIGAIILWNIYFRIMQDVSVSFVGELWDRNLLNLFTSPLNFREFFVGTMGLGIIKLIVSVMIMTASTYLFYQFNLFTIGPALFLLFFNLMLSGWTTGIIAVALIMRFGSRAEVLAWWIPFFIQPFSAVSFPVSILPSWMQKISFFIPVSHVFEGLRAVVIQNRFPANEMIAATILNVIYLTAATIFFSKILGYVKEKGLLAKLV